MRRPRLRSGRKVTTASDTGSNDMDYWRLWIIGMNIICGKIHKIPIKFFKLYKII